MSDPVLLTEAYVAANAGDHRAAALVGFVNDLRRELGSAQAMVERQRAAVEAAKRESALALQARVSADNVKHNADLQRVAALRDLQGAVALLVELEEWIPAEQARLRDAVGAFLDQHGGR